MIIYESGNIRRGTGGLSIASKIAPMAHTPERRGEKRDLFTITVEFALSEEETPSNDRVKGYGLTTNKSNGGIGLITNCPVDEGQRVVLFGNKLSDKLVAGNVRWCLKISEGIYRIGVRLN